VIELSAPTTMLAGQLLGDLGADVLVIEPSSGAAGRRMEPFAGSVPGLERSLVWQALNRNKRGMTLDVSTADGRAILDTLLAKADILLEAPPPGGTPLDLAPELAETLVHCVIWPFAESGPKSEYAVSDLVLMAASGALGNTGDHDRPPFPFPVPQSIMEASGEAATAVLAALVARDRDGTGQRVEVSARIAAGMSAFGQPLVIPSGNPGGPRNGGARGALGVQVPSIYPCADGFVVISVAFGSAFGPMTARLVNWLVDEGALPASFAEVDWPALPMRIAEGKEQPATLAALVDGISAFCAAHTKDELGEGGRSRALLLAPVMDMRDVYTSPQHRERGLWASTRLPALSVDVDLPARVAQLTGYEIAVRRPPPLLSQDTVAVLTEEAGLSLDEVQALFVHGVI
jgi:crotonobetainyl-CoA:carnitine CoA-transferase CaiB-like acyl-CoA transferase